MMLLESQEYTQKCIVENVCDCVVCLQTGVYSESVQNRMLDHSPRDFLPIEEKLRAPKFTVKDVATAIDLIFHTEGFH
jgi:hypothetical protein